MFTSADLLLDHAELVSLGVEHHRWELGVDELLWVLERLDLAFAEGDDPFDLSLHRPCVTRGRC